MFGAGSTVTLGPGNRWPRSAVVLAVIGVCLCVFGCAPGQSGGAAATRNVEEDRQAVVDAHLAMVRAYEYGDIEAFVAGLDSSPELLIFHPRLHSRFNGIEKVRQEIGRMFGRLGKSQWTDVHQVVVVNGDAAWLTSQVIIESPNLDPPFVGRSTEIYVRRPEGWRLTHAHWSADPESQY